MMLVPSTQQINGLDYHRIVPIQSDQEQLEKRLDPNNRKHPFDLGKKDMEPLAARALNRQFAEKELRRLRGHDSKLTWTY